MGKIGEKRGIVAKNWGKVVKNGEKLEKVVESEKSGEKWWKVVKSGEQWGKVIKWRKVAKNGEK